MPTFKNLKTTSVHESPMTVDPQPIIFGPPLPKVDGHESDTTKTANQSSTGSTSSTGCTTSSDTDVDMSDVESATQHKRDPASTLLDSALPQYIAKYHDIQQYEGDRKSEFFRFYQRKATPVALPRPLMIFSRSRAGEVAPFPLPRIYQFADMLHLVRCFRDAVLDHRRMWMDGVLHHDVTVYSILLGRVDAPVGLVGKLCQSKDAIYINPLDPRAPDESDAIEPHPDTKRLSFKSAMELCRLDSPNLEWPDVDHLDDMESMLYCLAWIAGYMDGPQRLHLATDAREWEAPTPAVSSTDKQSLLRSPMLTHLNTYFWRPAFWRMYSALAEICHARLRTKFSIAHLVDTGEFDRFPSLQETRAHFGGADHDRFLSVINEAIAEMEMSPDDKGHIKPRRRPAFTFADLRNMSNMHQKRPRAQSLSAEEESEIQTMANMARKLDKSAAEILGLPFPY